MSDEATNASQSAMLALYDFLVQSTIPFVVHEGSNWVVCGSGTLFTVGGERLIVTASHVASIFTSRRCFVPVGESIPHYVKLGRAPIYAMKEDREDVAVIHLSLEAAGRLSGRSFLTLDNVAPVNSPLTLTTLIVCGYPHVTTDPLNEILVRRPLALSTTPYNGSAENLERPLDPKRELLLTKLVRGDNYFGEQERVPPLHGMSGCGVWMTTAPREGPWVPAEHVKLLAVQTGVARSEGKWIRATMWGSVLRLLHNAIPATRDELRSRFGVT